MICNLYSTKYNLESEVGYVFITHDNYYYKELIPCLLMLQTFELLIQEQGTWSLLVLDHLQ